MRFHLVRNVFQINIQETWQLYIMIIMCVACPLSGYQYEFDAMMDASAASSSPSSSSSSPSSSSLLATSADASTMLAATLQQQQQQQQHRTTASAHNAATSTLATYDFLYSADYFYAATPMTLITLMPTDATAIAANANEIFYTQLPAMELDKVTQQQQQQQPQQSSSTSQLSSQLPESVLETSNDSNEIDSRDYVMTEHIASHDDEIEDDKDDGVASDGNEHEQYVKKSSSNDNEQNSSDDEDEDNDGDGKSNGDNFEHVNVYENGKRKQATHAVTFALSTQTSEQRQSQQQQQQQQHIINKHTHMHEMLSSTTHTQQQPQHAYGHLNKTQDLSSLSLLSFNNDNDNDESEDEDNNGDGDGAGGGGGVGNVAAVADAETTATLKKRLAEQQRKQQQHQHQQRQGSRNSGSSNNISVRSKNNNDPNGTTTTTTNFQQIGSQRITLRAPTLTADAGGNVAAAAAAGGGAGGGSITATSATVANGQRSSNNSSTNSNGNAKNSYGKTNTAGQSAHSISSGGSGSTSSRKVESKYILPKPQKTDAPMLNYIFDTFSSANKHHHHDQRYGPHFEDVERLGQPTNLTVQAGSSIHLNCKISLLQDKTVSWVRRHVQGENALDLLTVGPHTYTGDKRYKLEFQYPNNWRLKITNVKKDDEATYECQISTHPPRVIQINLLVNAPKVMIVDEFGDPLQEKYYEIDSTLQLSCVVRNVAMTTSVVYWKHGEDVLNYDVTRGGVSVKTELMDDGANSTLSIAKINKADSGNYTCSINEFQNFSINVHILNGESFAELHHGGAAAISLRFYHHTLAINLTLLIFLFCLPAATMQR